ncbi:hypothetical protein F7018_09125 [Tenacibaculum aiptasiae]|uniref:Uncharacterized protein n=1 Tax=Tenacibaculum aiptasiae TaxID=426481 RepID=A0A7J5AL83_9FLAO|nr:hypothetical protein [Tenacibaculum aiptasiae]KAB1158334.1 hypothetical protein F7018_09125 [Tenacibaculum aiptasiae]
MKKSKKYKKRFDANLIIAFGVLLASIGALMISTRQASIMNEQTKIFLEQSKSSAWPSLSIGMSRSFDNDTLNKYSLIISNRGIGPAIVTETKITFDGKPISNWEEFYKVAKIPDTIVKRHGNDILLNRVIKPGEDFLLIDWSLNPLLMNYIYKYSDKISIRICYKSVFGDYWEVVRKGFKNNLEKSITTEVSNYKASEDILFLE